MDVVAQHLLVFRGGGVVEDWRNGSYSDFLEEEAGSSLPAARPDAPAEPAAAAVREPAPPATTAPKVKALSAMEERELEIGRAHV